MDARLRRDGLTTQQAAVLTAVRVLDRPAVADVAAALGATRQNVSQLVAALHRKGMLAVEPRLRRHPATWFAALDAEHLETFCGLAERLLGADDEGSDGSD